MTTKRKPAPANTGPICPFCSAPWSEENVRVWDVDSAGQPLVPLVRCKVDGKLRPLAARKSAKRKARK